MSGKQSRTVFEECFYTNGSDGAQSSLDDAKNAVAQLTDEQYIALTRGESHLMVTISVEYNGWPIPGLPRKEPQEG